MPSLLGVVGVTALPASQLINVMTLNEPLSHWPVSSEAAVALTTRMLAEYSPDTGRAEALRRSMLALMDNPRFAHPFYWAPFVIVGEGGGLAVEAEA